MEVFPEIINVVTVALAKFVTIFFTFSDCYTIL